jgi:hypothetical protein
LIIVGVADLTTEAGIADFSVEKNLLYSSGLFLRRRANQVQGFGIYVGRIKLEANRISRGKRFVEPLAD